MQLESSQHYSCGRFAAERSAANETPILSRCSSDLRNIKLCDHISRSTSVISSLEGSASFEALRATILADYRSCSKSTDDRRNIFFEGSVVDRSTEIGYDNIFGPGVVVSSRAKIGSRNIFLSYSQIGVLSPAFANCLTGNLQIGDENVFFPFSTIEYGTSNGKTTIGDRNRLMKGSHIGHDSKLINDNKVGNFVQTAGYVTLLNNTNVGSMSMIKQHCILGDGCFIIPRTDVRDHVSPFTIKSSYPRFNGRLNIVLLKRMGFNLSEIKILKTMIKNKTKKSILHSSLIQLYNNSVDIFCEVTGNS